MEKKNEMQSGNLSQMKRASSLRKIVVWGKIHRQAHRLFKLFWRLLGLAKVNVMQFPCQTATGCCWVAVKDYCCCVNHFVCNAALAPTPCLCYRIVQPQLKVKARATTPFIDSRSLSLNMRSLSLFYSNSLSLSLSLSLSCRLSGYSFPFCTERLFWPRVQHVATCCSLLSAC